MEAEKGARLGKLEAYKRARLEKWRLKLEEGWRNGG